MGSYGIGLDRLMAVIVELHNDKDGIIWPDSVAPYQVHLVHIGKEGDGTKEKAEALADALDKATPGINSVREAMKQLGITSDASLKQTAATAKDAYDTLTASGTASARELSEAFKKTAGEFTLSFAPFDLLYEPWTRLKDDSGVSGVLVT